MLIQFAMFPTAGSESVSGEVSQIIDIIDKSGLPYRTSAMSTVIEGEWDEITELINKCRLKLRENNRRVYMVMTMDDRKDARNRLFGKVESLEKKLNKKIKS
ncbi:MAG: MTH1187 family thiamine-binding protein [Candidatus Zixiibacteriota bacterium]|nr:MAG: MTH1187 family thiamine-binding protein [candidate division Zixibacteria bacterium]